MCSQRAALEKSPEVSPPDNMADDEEGPQWLKEIGHAADNEDADGGRDVFHSYTYRIQSTDCLVSSLVAFHSVAQDD